MILCHIMCHVTAVIYLFIVQEIKEKKRKIKIKSKKIDKRKEKKNKRVQVYHDKQCNSLIRAVVSKVVDRQLVNSMRLNKKNTSWYLQRTFCENITRLLDNMATEILNKKQGDNIRFAKTSISNRNKKKQRN